VRAFPLAGFFVNRNAERQLDQAWLEAVRIIFRQQILAAEIEGPADTDRHLSKREKAVRDLAIDFIAKQIGCEAEYVRNALTEAAHNYRSAPGSEADPSWLAPPNWTGFKAGWEIRTEVVVPQADAGGLSQ
jgi:hypothetical protein